MCIQSLQVFTLLQNRAELPRVRGASPLRPLPPSAQPRAPPTSSIASKGTQGSGHGGTGRRG